MHFGGLITLIVFWNNAGANVFADLCFDFAFAYIDGLIVFSHSFPPHLNHREAVLSRMEKYNLHRGLSKCKFAHELVEYLGHVIDRQGIRPEPGHIQNIVNWKPLLDVDDVKSFSHILGYYHDFNTVLRISLSHSALPSLERTLGGRGQKESNMRLSSFSLL